MGFDARGASRAKGCPRSTPTRPGSSSAYLRTVHAPRVRQRGGCDFQGVYKVGVRFFPGRAVGVPRVCCVLWLRPAVFASRHRGLVDAPRAHLRVCPFQTSDEPHACLCDPPRRNTASHPDVAFVVPDEGGVEWKLPPLSPVASSAAALHKLLQTLRPHARDPIGRRLVRLYSV